MAKIIFVLEDVDGQVAVSVDKLDHEDGAPITQAMVLAFSMYNACLNLPDGPKEENDKEAD